MADKQVENPACDSTQTPLERARKTVADLYFYRDHYFEDHQISEAIKKDEDVRKRMDDAIKSLQQMSNDITQKAEFLMLHGKALNVLPGYSNQAEEFLSKAVKLDPRLMEAWIQLGEVYWKNHKVEDAKNCFQGALQHGKDKTALRNLSMVMRQLNREDKETGKLIEESVDRAKEAVQLDIKDGTSWCVLGNAYLSLFFASTQNPRLLKQCMSAYQQAERDPVSRANPDLHFNRATAYKYEEDYTASIEGFSKAAALDPTWEEPKVKVQQTVAYLDRVADLVKAKGKLKAKRLANMISTLSPQDLGPYVGGSYTSGRNGKTIKLDHVMLADLQSLQNMEKVVVGKVVCSVVSDEPVPFTFCMVDKSGTCFAVTVYNIAPGYGVKIGDSVAIAEPYQHEVNVTYNDKTYQYNCIRVGSPVVMVVNGRKLTIDKQAPTQLSVKTVSD